MFTPELTDDQSVFSDILSGDDVFYLSKYSDTALGFGGNDLIYSYRGNDTLDGGTGADTLIGGFGNDSYVTDGGDTIREAANHGTDLIRSSVSLRLGTNLENLTLTGPSMINGTGNSLANTITGNGAANVLNGGTGADTLIGGSGSDTFVFNAAVGANNVDRIKDYDVAADTIRLENAIFVGLGNGTLSAAAFKSNATGNATDATDRIIYESDTGKLFFDADGNGAGAHMQFAVLNPGLSLTSADFFVV